MVDATHDSPDLNLYDGSATEVVDYVVTLGADGLVSAATYNPLRCLTLSKCTVRLT